MRVDPIFFFHDRNHKLSFATWEGTNISCGTGLGLGLGLIKISVGRCDANTSVPQ